MEYISLKTPIFGIYCKEAFLSLSQVQKRYAYYLYKASWYGYLISFYQRSFEGPALAYIFYRIFSNESPQQLREKLLQSPELNEDELNRVYAYCGAILGMGSPYRSTGEKKYIPEIDKSKFVYFLEQCKGYQQEKDSLSELWKQIEEVIYNIDHPYKEIGFPGIDRGLCPYYSVNLQQEEAEGVEEFLTKMKLEYRNTRLFKEIENENEKLIVRLASILKKTEKYQIFVKNQEKQLFFEFGDFDFILEKVNENLVEAQKHSENEQQRRYIDLYIQHYYTGDFSVYLQSQIEWLKDISPVIEYQSGYSLTYLDPRQQRAEFMSIVSINSKIISEKTNSLVSRAPELLQLMPWPRTFEKDIFLKPDFTCIECLSFGFSYTPLGLCLPHFDDIKQKYGFKNLLLLNSIMPPKIESLQFLSESTAQQLISHYKTINFFVICYHELLGHGSGKIFIKEQQEQYNFNFGEVINPLSQLPVDSYYLSGETFFGKFGKYANAYEECRSDTVAMYFACFQESWAELFPEYVNTWQDMTSLIWIYYIDLALRGLEHYSTETSTWRQAHINGRFVIFQKLFQEAPDLIQIKVNQEHTHFHLVFNSDKLFSHGLPVLKDLLLKLQVYKSTADSHNGLAMFDQLSTVNSDMLVIRDIVISKRQPKRIEIHPVLSVNSDNGDIEYYEPTQNFEGLISSFVSRFDELPKGFLEKWYQDLPYLKWNKLPSQ